MTSTEPTSTESPKLLRELQTIVSACNPPHNEAPSVIRRRRSIVAIVLLIGAAVLGYSLSLQPGDSAFYGATMALAGVWAIGAFVSGPLHLGCVRFRGRNQRPIVTGVGIGALLGGVFIVGGLIVREIGPVAEYIRSVLEYAQQGSLPMIVAALVMLAWAYRQAPGRPVTA